MYGIICVLYMKIWHASNTDVQHEGARCLTYNTSFSTADWDCISRDSRYHATCTMNDFGTQHYVLLIGNMSFQNYNPRLCYQKRMVTKFERVRDKEVFFLTQVLTSLVYTESTDDKIVRIVALPSVSVLIGTYLKSASFPFYGGGLAWPGIWICV